MSNDRSYEEDISYWLFDENGEERDEGWNDAMLTHLSDQEIEGLSDSYDDGRITRLVYAYTELRRRLTL